jgi:2-C-methyl-D-erythritol 2,4-cyclodiphosphate synthase
VRVGQGVDAHKLVPGRRLVLGGVEIPCDRGLEGHSDGDVLLHAVASALLGALGEGDLGRHFPSHDPALSGIASREIVRRVAERLAAAGFAVGNVDATIVAQTPRLAPHREKMEGVIAGLLEVPPERVNVKITSTDHLGFIGREEGIAALAVALIADAEERVA